MTGAVRGSLWLFLVNLVGKGGQVAVTLVLAALLTEEGLGLVALAVSVVNIGQVVQSVGVYDVISRTRLDPRRVAGTLLTLSVGTGAVLAVLLVAMSGVVADAVGAPGVAPLVALAALSLPGTAAAGVQMGLLHRELDFRRRMLPDAGGALLGAAVTIGLAVLGWGPYALVCGLLCTAVAQPALGALVGVRVRPAWDAGAAAEASRWIAVVGPGALVAVLLVNVDYLAVGRVLGAEAVGVYSLAYRIAWVPYVVVAVVLGGVVFPWCAKLVRAGRPEELPAAAGRATHALLVVTGGLYAVTAAMADRVVLFGDRWAPAAAPLALLCGYGLGFGLLHLWYQVIRAAGHARRYLALELTHLAALVLALLVCTRHGVVAVAATQLAVVWALVPVAWRVLARRGLAPPGLGRMAAGVAAGAVCCLVVARSVGGLFGPTVPGALGEGLVLVLGYAAAVLLTDRRAVRELREVRR
ncbi:oligosaccharide flippase family protein [Saccharothrix australiensis]|uniref:PST family polysaccharide transporter n=1 Tax=Saccharothrix australiensis TaxID=2072 RepID=A0A495W317_9PSEU|nr:oligosaccharide flippase family protein [Saccharothrix australiensis]RKT55437.1 PST family polysaccharide transporter [Saccharothrix australiensis]